MIISLAVDSDLAAKFLFTLDSEEGLEGSEQGEGNLTENVLFLPGDPRFSVSRSMAFFVSISLNLANAEFVLSVLLEKG